MAGPGASRRPGSGDEQTPESLRAQIEWLRESEKMHRSAAELSGRMVWSADREGQILAMSRVFESLTGEPTARALGGGWLDFVHPEDRAATEAHWTHSVATGEPFAIEFRSLLASGEVRWTLSRAIPVRDKEGAIARWYGFSQDVHEKREAQEARRSAEERFRLAVQATNDAVWDYDLKAGMVEWSDNSGEILGLAEPPGRTTIAWWGEHIHPDERERVERSLESAIELDASHWSASYRFRRADGSYADILDRGFIIRDPRGRPIRAVGAMADLTDRNRAEAEIRRMQTELIHVSRLSAMGAMASALAHELNQPLAAVTNFISGARRLAGRDEAVRSDLLGALEAAESSAQRAGEIVRRLREFVARGTVTVQAENLPRLIEEASVLAFVDERLLGITHRLELDPDAPWVLADGIQIQQVLINLIRNAIEAMVEGPTREVVIATRALDDMVEISIADTGPGVPDHVETLFSHFMTTKSGGMGMGLPISRTIVELHGGEIWGENRPGGGAKFRFTLPKPPRRPQKPG